MQGSECDEDRIRRLLHEISVLKIEGARLRDGALPHPPFVWPETAEEIRSTTADILRKTQQGLDSVAALKDDELSFSSVIKPLMCPPNYKTNPQVAAAKFLQHCSTDAAIRDAAEQAGQALSEARVQGRMRADVYERVDMFSRSDAAATLNPYQTHFLNAILADFRRGGLALDAAQRAELQELMAEDAQLCSKYKTNISSDDTEVFFTRDELEGLSDAFLDAHIVASDAGTSADQARFRITLRYPDIVPVFGQCACAETRRKLMQAREQAYGDNVELMSRAVQLRLRIAELLGYASWAHFVTEQRMTGQPKVANEFLSDLAAKLQDSGKRELARLTALKAEHLAERSEDTDSEFHAWDLSFYHNLLMKRAYGVDDEAVRQYFPCFVVVEQTLSIYQELLGLTFIELPRGEFWCWHHEVRCFVVLDSSTRQLVGHFYLDLHPRPHKYPHAAIFHLLKGKGPQGKVDCMLCNLPAPAADGTPALLRHDDVVTFFHEFGHIMHGLCAEGDGNSTRLAKCPRDFVEAPSQMLENWCWQPEVLERLSSHYETKQPLPAELLAKLVAAKHVNCGLFTLRQIYLASLDMTLHSEHPPGDLQALVDEMRPKISLIKNPPGCNMLRSFGHLMNQYSAAYHGYLWSEVLSADMFQSRFAKEGIFNSATGMSYRKNVLAVGGVGSIMDHLTVFLGSPPSNEHFLRSRGIIE